MIRKATQKDASRIAEILIFAKRTAYRDIFKNDKVSFGEMQVLPLALEFSNHPSALANFYVYDDEFVKGVIHLSDDCEIPEIAELYIDPFFQKHAIGSLLLEFAQAKMRELGHAHVFLWVLEKNTAARNFYEKHGFVPTSGRKLQDGTPESIVQYCKSL